MTDPTKGTKQTAPVYPFTIHYREAESDKANTCDTQVKEDWLTSKQDYRNSQGEQSQIGTVSTCGENIPELHLHREAVDTDGDGNVDGNRFVLVLPDESGNNQVLHQWDPATPTHIVLQTKADTEGLLRLLKPTVYSSTAAVDQHYRDERGPETRSEGKKITQVDPDTRAVNLRLMAGPGNGTRSVNLTTVSNNAADIGPGDTVNDSRHPVTTLHTSVGFNLPTNGLSWLLANIPTARLQFTYGAGSFEPTKDGIFSTGGDVSELSGGLYVGARLNSHQLYRLMSGRFDRRQGLLPFQLELEYLTPAIGGYSVSTPMQDRSGTLTFGDEHQLTAMGKVDIDRFWTLGVGATLTIQKDYPDNNNLNNLYLRNLIFGVQVGFGDHGESYTRIQPVYGDPTVEVSYTEPTMIPAPPPPAQPPQPRTAEAVVLVPKKTFKTDGKTKDFRSGSHRLTKDGKNQAKRLAGEIVSYLQDLTKGGNSLDGSLYVVIDGHTDQDGPTTKNMPLSQKRADSFQVQLSKDINRALKDAGLKDLTKSIVYRKRGFGETQLLETKDASRRVEVMVTTDVRDFAKQDFDLIAMQPESEAEAQTRNDAKLMQKVAETLNRRKDLSVGFDEDRKALFATTTLQWDGALLTRKDTNALKSIAKAIGGQRNNLKQVSPVVRFYFGVTSPNAASTDYERLNRASVAQTTLIDYKTWPFNGGTTVMSIPKGEDAIAHMEAHADLPPGSSTVPPAKLEAAVTKAKMGVIQAGGKSAELYGFPITVANQEISSADLEVLKFFAKNKLQANPHLYVELYKGKDDIFAPSRGVNRAGQAIISGLRGAGKPATAANIKLNAVRDDRKSTMLYVVVSPEAITPQMRKDAHKEVFDYAK